MFRVRVNLSTAILERALARCDQDAVLASHFATRITFTVVGAAANEAARLEALSKTLNASPLVSEQVASQVPLEWQSLGRHKLRGVGKPIKVFTL